MRMRIEDALELIRSKGNRSRRLDQRKVDRLAADMARGAWTPPPRAGGAAEASGGPAGA